MVSIEELLEEMDELFDKATVVPLSGGKAMVNADRVRELIDEIRLHLPQEIRQARAIAADRNDIIADARKEAESIIRKAEDRARLLINQEEITRRATIQANELIAQEQTKAREIRRGAIDYAENMMRTTEDIISQKLTELRQARQNLRTTVRNENNAHASESAPVVEDEE